MCFDEARPVTLQCFAIPWPVEVKCEFRKITEDLVSKGTKKRTRKESQPGMTAWTPIQTAGFSAQVKAGWRNGVVAGRLDVRGPL